MDLSLMDVWKAWICSELHQGCTPGGLVKFGSQITCFQKLDRNEEPTDEEWEQGIQCLLYEYRGIYLIRGIVDGTVEVSKIVLKAFSHDQVASMNDWAGRSMLLALQRHVEETETEITCTEPCIAVTSTDDLRTFVVIEGNHRCRALLRAKKGELNFFVLYVPFGQITEACHHVC